jgi:hypothetical protein
MVLTATEQEGTVMNRSDAYLTGFDAGYDTANFTDAYGGDVEVSYSRYREADGSRAEYREGFNDGVQSFKINADLFEWGDESPAQILGRALRLLEPDDMGFDDE